MTKHVNLGNSRTGKYAKVIKKIAEKKICPFCPENIDSIHPNPIQSRSLWLVTNNAYPYIPNREHILLVHKKHITDIKDLSKEAWLELKEIINDECKKRKISGGSMMLRFGDPKFTGASVTHLHAHLFQSDPNNPKYNKKKGVLTRIG